MKRTRVTRLLGATLIGAIGATALVMMSSPGAQAAGTPCQRTFSSGTVDLPIPDRSEQTSMIDVPEDGLVVTDVDVLVDIHHTFDADLTVSLASQTDDGRDRAEATLFDRSGSGEDNLLGTVLDDSAPLPISWGKAPFTGRFLPTTPLSTVAGSAGGRWFLLAKDDADGDTGTLNDWSLTLTYASCDFDRDGVEDHADDCRSITAATPSGCPTASRTVTGTYRHGAFRGHLSSTAPTCATGRAVTVFRVRSGPDARVGVATTHADGTYRLTRARHQGRYYATSPATVVQDVTECAAARSTTFRLR